MSDLRDRICDILREYVSLHNTSPAGEAADAILKLFAAPAGTQPPTDALTIDELDECMKGYDIGDVNQHVVLGRINKALESRIAAALSAAQDTVREEEKQRWGTFFHKDTGTVLDFTEICEKARKWDELHAPKPEIPEGFCALCGKELPEGEKMFKYHGYSGPCPTSAGTPTTETGPK